MQIDLTLTLRLAPDVLELLRDGVVALNRLADELDGTLLARPGTTVEPQAVPMEPVTEADRVEAHRALDAWPAATNTNPDVLGSSGGSAGHGEDQDADRLGAKPDPVAPSAPIAMPAVSWSEARLALLDAQRDAIKPKRLTELLNELPGRELTLKAVQNKLSMRRLATMAAIVAVAPPPEPMIVPAPMKRPAAAPPRGVSDIMVPRNADPFDVQTFTAKATQLNNREDRDADFSEVGNRSTDPHTLQLIDANFADIRAWAARHGVTYRGTNIGDVNRERRRRDLPQLRLSMSARPVLL